MNREYLRSHEFTKNGILQNAFAPHGNDGLQAHQDVTEIVREHQRRQFCHTLLAGSSAGLALSVFNLTRFGVLSPSGRSAALAGTVFFSFLSYAAIDRIGYFRSAPKSDVESQKKENSQQ